MAFRGMKPAGTKTVAKPPNTRKPAQKPKKSNSKGQIVAQKSKPSPVIRKMAPQQKIRIKKRSKYPTIAKVTTLQPYEKVLVGQRWYSVRGIRMIGSKRDRGAICIVHTVEKGGMYFPARARVKRADPDVEVD